MHGTNKKPQHMIHVSFDLVDNFIPRLPKQRAINEDCTVKRICVAPSLRSALMAIPKAGQVVHTLKRIGLPVILHAYYLNSDSVLMSEQISSKVPDALFTGEMWLTDVPQSVYRVDYELVDSYVPELTDLYGVKERFVVCSTFRKVKYQSNWRNFAYKVAKDPEIAEAFLEEKPQMSFRRFIEQLDDTILQSLDIELQEVEE